MNKLSKITILSILLSPIACARSKIEITKKIQPKSKSKVSGELSLYDIGQDILITGELKGLKPNSKFGFHIHENDDCSSDDAKSAGDHFSPNNHEHGAPTDIVHHKGDLGNLESDAKGIVFVKTKVPDANLAGESKKSILNRALIIHAGQDDFTTRPSGSSGKRIACLEIN